MPGYGQNFDYGLSPLYKDIDYNRTIPNILFSLLPNWKYSIFLEYKFQTVIARRRKMSEQRKALRPIGSRMLSFSVTDNKNHALIQHYLMSIKASRITMPIFTEPCRPSGIGSLVGVTDIAIRNDSIHYYNLRHRTTDIILIDLTETVDNEIKTLTALDTTTGNITISSGISNNFLKETTVIFPLFDCYLTKKTLADHSDTMTKFDLEFTEYK